MWMREWVEVCFSFYLCLLMYLPTYNVGMDSWGCFWRFNVSFCLVSAWELRFGVSVVLNAAWAFGGGVYMDALKCTFVCTFLTLIMRMLLRLFGWLFVCLRALWPDLAKFHHFDQNLKIFGNIIKLYLVLGKVFSSLWYKFFALGQFFIAWNGQILKTQSGRLVTLFERESDRG